LPGKQQPFAKEGEGYLEHIKEWYPHREDPNVMFLIYEEMKQVYLRIYRGCETRQNYGVNC